MLELTNLYRRTEKGAAEIRDRAHGLEQRFRRALLMIDGTRDVTELSVIMRPGEIESSLAKLIEGGFVELVPADEMPTDRIVYVAIANDPRHFADIKLNFVAECSARLGAFAETVIAEINSCETALELRIKLRDIESILVAALGDSEGIAFSHALGEELTRLVPR
jgi:hypothetical protein